MATLRMTNRKAMDESFMQMATYILVIGRIASLMAKEHTPMWMVLAIRVTGSTISTMGLEMNLGQTAQSTAENMLTERNKAKASSSGKTEAASMASLSQTKCRVKVHMSGAMVASIKAIGVTT